MMGAIAKMLQNLYEGTDSHIGLTAVVAAAAVLIRFVCNILSARMGYLSSKAVKKTLREMIYRKLLRLGTSYKEQANTSEVVQVAVEGVDQLETYFGAYLPQFFYAMLAPLTLFAVLSFISFPAAVVLLICNRQQVKSYFAENRCDRKALRALVTSPAMIIFTVLMLLMSLLRATQKYIKKQ